MVDLIMNIVGIIVRLPYLIDLFMFLGCLLSCLRRRRSILEVYYFSAYCDIVWLSNTGRHAEAVKLADQLCLDSKIPPLLRVLVCDVLAETAKGDCIKFAEEAVEWSEKALALMPYDQSLQRRLRQLQEILDRANATLRNEQYEEDTEPVLVAPSFNTIVLSPGSHLATPEPRLLGDPWTLPFTPLKKARMENGGSTED